ncbi:MAG: autotransporter domain-containing protein, partial [Akkermansia sp.]
LGARLMGLVGSNIFGRESLGELRVQVAQDFGDTDSEGKVAFKGSNNRQTVYGSKMGTTGVVFGAGLSVPVNQQGTIYVDANADVRSRATSVNGNIGYRYNF